jgi:hypothetical protein
VRAGQPPSCPANWTAERCFLRPCYLNPILRARKVVKFKISKPFRKTMNGQQVTAEDEADEDGGDSDIDTPASAS